MTTTTSVRSAHRRRRRLQFTPLFTVVALSILSVLMIFPFAWMVSTSLKTPATAFLLPPQLWPSEWRFENYRQVLFHPSVPILLFFANSIKIAVLITLGQLITCTLAAYAFARMQFPGRDVLFVVLLTALMVPAQITIIPVFIEMRALGLIDTHWALILPSITSIYGVFLLRQYFLTIPRELEDAARIDGAGPLRILWQIMVPLVAPGLATLEIITFTGCCNEFFRPLIFLNTWSGYTWPLGLTMLRGTYGQGSISVIMAGITLGVLPVLAIFLLAQQKMIESLAFTGVKG